MSARARYGAVAAAVSAAAAWGGTPASAAVPTLARCDGARPTATRAWRAFVPAGTPLRAAPRSSTRHAPIPLDGRWLLVLGRARAHDGRCLLMVRTPNRPNTSHAWVARSRVSLRRTSWRIEVSRHARTVTLRRAGRAVRRWPVVIGAPATPTPAGTFAVLSSYRPPRGGFYGTWILTLTAHSRVLDRFDGGDGRTGLHGRGGASLADPLGSARSHGCVRFDNHAISTIVRRIGRARLAGVPVVIR
ncbi:MAG TPA: L,D-transpeptidase [Baekduia sp.]|nr:L,D-transpeptidase [Baekduia sp.]